METKDNSKYEFKITTREEAIKRRFEGEDVLSWIEHFGIHFLEDGKYNGKPNSDDHFLVLRINSHKDNDEDTIYADYCFFKTDEDGVTKFCVKKQCQYTQDRLRKLFINAQWNFPKTINWWQKVFRDGFQDIDDILARPEIIVSDSCNMKMQDFLQKINEVITDLILKLELGSTQITKVCMVEQYAYALPLKYVLYKMFPNSYIYRPYVFKDKNPMRNHSWLDSHPFYISTALLDKSLNTSPTSTIADVLHLGENGVTITMPLLNAELDSSVIDGCDLKWSNLLPDDVLCDYQMDNLKFKRMQLSMLADGLQNIYIKGIGKNAVITLEDGKIKVLYKKSITDEHQIVESITPESLPQESSVPPNNTAKLFGLEASVTEENVIEKTAFISSFQNLPSSIDSDPTTPFENIENNDDYDKKCENIFNAVNNALTRTRDDLEDIARLYLETAFPNNDWREKYGEALKERNGNEDIYRYKTWKTGNRIEFSNFLHFLWFYRNKITTKGKKQASWWKSYTDIESAVKFLIPIRNFTTHWQYDVVGVGYRNLSRSFDDMIKIATALQDQELEERINEYLSIFEENFDTRLKEIWKTNASLQEIFKLFKAELKI